MVKRIIIFMLCLMNYVAAMSNQQQINHKSSKNQSSPYVVSSSSSLPLDRSTLAEPGQVYPDAESDEKGATPFDEEDEKLLDFIGKTNLYHAKLLKAMATKLEIRAYVHANAELRYKLIQEFEKNIADTWLATVSIGPAYYTEQKTMTLQQLKSETGTGQRTCYIANGNAVRGVVGASKTGKPLYVKPLPKAEDVKKIVQAELQKRQKKEVQAKS